MRKDKPSRTAYKVALNIVTLGSKPEMDKFLPPGTVKATEELLVASGAGWSKNSTMGPFATNGFYLRIVRLDATGTV